MKDIYVMISRTDTGFAKLIRRFTGCYYNHAAIAFDSELRQLYSFARRARDLPLSACLTRENPLMYTLGQGDAEIVLYRVPVTEERFITARRTVQMMLRDGGYIYNVLSVFTYPVTRGLPAYKAQTCSEFTAGILRVAGVPLDRPDCRYHPEDFTRLLAGHEIYRGSLTAYCGDSRRLDGDPAYLRRHTLVQIAGNSLRTLAWAADRSLFERPAGLPDVTGRRLAQSTTERGILSCLKQYIPNRLSAGRYTPPGSV